MMINNHMNDMKSFLLSSLNMNSDKDEFAIQIVTICMVKNEQDIIEPFFKT